MYVIFFIVVIYLIAIMPKLKKHKDIPAFQGRFYAHRGLFDNQTDHPENSLKAFQRAIDHGYGIEMDVQLTKDNIPVVIHDDTIDRVVFNHTGKVCDYTYEELKTFHLCDSQQTIPTMQEFLDLVRGQVPVIIEYKVKESDTELLVCQIVNKMLEQYEGLYCIESFNPRVPLWYRRHKPEIMRGQLSDEFYRDGMKSFVHYACGFLLLNFLTKPDFIAYNIEREQNLSRRIDKYLYRNTSVAWTLKSQEQYEKNKSRFDLFIFDSFIPNSSLLRDSK